MKTFSIEKDIGKNQSLGFGRLCGARKKMRTIPTGERSARTEPQEPTENRVFVVVPTVSLGGSVTEQVHRKSHRSIPVTASGWTFAERVS